jgi:CubicO group peptidase (beta-lactamase class C family)
MKYLLLSIAIIIQIIPFAVKANDNFHTELTHLMKESYQRGLFNGNISIIHQGKSIFEKQIGFIDGTKNRELSINSAFALGSITKEFNAVAIMMLHEKGLIDINASLSTFNLELPSWSEKIKVKHLLNYTSGLPRLDFRAVKVSSDIDGQLQQINKLEFMPGEGYLYSNHNVFLQMKLIEVITKQPYATFINDYLFKPLEMKNSFFDSSNKNAVSAFNNEGKDDIDRPFPIAFMVYSTTTDMQKWLSALHTGKLVSPSSLEVLFNTFNQNSNAALGQGQLTNKKVVKHRHQGSHFNFESQIYYNEELDLQVVLLTNNKNFKLDEITHGIESIVQSKNYVIPKKSLYLSIRQSAYDDILQAIKRYNELKHTSPTLYDFDNNNALIRIGYKLIEQKKYQSAIEIFKLSTREFPNHANAFDSLAEAYYLNGSLDLALKNYQTSVKINPSNKNGMSMVSKIKGMIQP